MTATTAPQTQTIRDPRLDFYRGMAMFIILMAHTPGNWWNQWIPARFGLSDAAEIFVFCSGMASAVAFGRTYQRRGWLLGTSRIAFRVWQIYWAHIATFLLTAMVLAAIDTYGGFEKSYIAGLNLGRFFNDTATQLVGLFTLTYVPNFFDILPMYMMILIMVPIVMALAKINLWLVAGFVGMSWFLAQGALLEWLGIGWLQISLPAEPWSERAWFFNPFAWQLVFFAGFALMSGWIPAPPINAVMIALVGAVLVGGFMVSSVAIRELGFDWVNGWRAENRGWISKTNGGILRYIHFLAVAYLGWAIAGPQGRNIVATGTSLLAGLWRGIVALITKVGQQSLAVFLTTVVLSRILGFIFDQTGNAPLPTALVNMFGFALIILTAYGAAWFKGQPWRGPAKA
ncbi:OpgC domain-containing protein [Yoonia sp. SS1-5]|uniref:OpgC family protein n=1 Tax=Yoonia rhodophyticola TaxID=3137370 RepID=A0AAN0MIK3_9RHOB